MWPGGPWLSCDTSETGVCVTDLTVSPSVSHLRVVGGADDHGKAVSALAGADARIGPRLGRLIRGGGGGVRRARAGVRLHLAKAFRGLPSVEQRLRERGGKIAIRFDISEITSRIRARETYHLQVEKHGDDAALPAKDFASLDPLCRLVHGEAQLRGAKGG